MAKTAHSRLDSKDPHPAQGDADRQLPEDAREQSRVIGSRLIDWFSGRGTGPSRPADPGSVRTVFLESAEHLDLVTDPHTGVAGAGSYVFFPEGGARPRHNTEACLVPYAGSLAFPGDELVIGDDNFFQVLDYRASAYLSVVGLTAVRIADEDDYAAFVADADLAYREGVFPAQLLHPLVTLADRCALGDGLPCAGPVNRLHVAKSGQVRTAPGGRLLGSVAEDLRTALAAAVAHDEHSAGGDLCLAEAVPLETVRDAVAARPWLSRYLWATEAIRQCHLRGMTGLSVAGFGGSRIAGLPAAAHEEPTDAPMILWDGQDTVILVTIPHLRAFKLEPDAAALAEFLLVGGSIERAADLAHEYSALPPAVALPALRGLSADFLARGVDLLGAARCLEGRC